MINGIDLLITFVCIAILVVLWILTDAYLDWARLDRDRRRQRKLAVHKQHEIIEENEYRQNLRVGVIMLSVTANIRSFQNSLHKMEQAFRDLSKSFASVAK